MNRILLQNNKIYSNVKMIVFDMIGTTINDNGIVYKTLYDSMKDFGLDINKNEMKSFYGLNKYKVLEDVLINQSTKYQDINILKKQLFYKFDTNLKQRYLESSNFELMDPKIPELFNHLRKNNIIITINTDYSRDIQESIINKFDMTEFIDDYISSQQVKMGKPLPYMIQQLMIRNNIYNSKSVIKVGDTPKDILEGINANCLSSIGVLSGSCSRKQLNKANDIINNVTDITST